MVVSLLAKAAGIKPGHGASQNNAERRKEDRVRSLPEIKAMNADDIEVAPPFGVWLVVKKGKDTYKKRLLCNCRNPAVVERVIDQLIEAVKP